MKLLHVVIAMAAIAALSASVVSANPITPRVDRRELRQQARIQQGVRSGELTRGEAARLRAGQRHMRRMEARDKRDGVVTPRERIQLNRAQNLQSRRIVRFKHNGRGN